MVAVIIRTTIKLHLDLSDGLSIAMSVISLTAAVAYATMPSQVFNVKFSISDDGTSPR